MYINKILPTKICDEDMVQYVTASTYLIRAIYHQLATPYCVVTVLVSLALSLKEVAVDVAQHSLASVCHCEEL